MAFHKQYNLSTSVSLSCAALLAGCMAGEPEGGADAAAADGDMLSPDESVVSTDLTATSALTIHNPVVESCADPGVMRDGAKWYLTCTSGSGGNLFPIYESSNLLSWHRVGYIFPAGAQPRCGKGNWWAPELHHVAGGFEAYFTTLDGTHNAVGAAFSPTLVNPGGYRDRRGSPLTSRDASSIDGHMLIDQNGKRFLYFKREGNPDQILVHELTADGEHLAGGNTKAVLSVDRGWERGVVEAPWVQFINGWYYLFYSGAQFCNQTYAVGVARSRSPIGPFTKHPTPILTSGTRWVGPGHVSITSGPDGQLYMVYHAYRVSEARPQCNPPRGTRHTLVDRIAVENGWPKVISNL